VAHLDAPVLRSRVALAVVLLRLRVFRRRLALQPGGGGAAAGPRVAVAAVGSCVFARARLRFVVARFVAVCFVVGVRARVAVAERPSAPVAVRVAHRHERPRISQGRRRGLVVDLERKTEDAKITTNKKYEF
jgi:hypothetical protein